MSRRGGRSARGRREGQAAAAAARQRARVESVGNVRIDSIAAGGDGVGRVDGLACFVPRTAPGDLAQVAFQTHARHARGRVLQLLELSADRVEPTCRHYEADRCGGCQLQHLSASAQRDARLTIVQDALRRIGKRDVPRADLVSGAQWAYRGRLTLTLRPRGGAWTGGLHPFDDPVRVFELEECAIAHPSLVAAWHAVRSQSRGLPAAPMLRLALRRVDAPSESVDSSVAQANGDAVALVVIGGTAWEGAAEWGASLLRAHAPLAAVWWQSEQGATTLIAARRGVAAAELLGGMAVQGTSDVDEGPEPTEALAFAQVNEEVAAALRAYVQERVLAFAPKRVVDAYAGVGVLSALLAEAGVGVTAIEADSVGAESARRRLASAADARVITDTVEAALAASLPTDVVVLNPPRRGVDIRVTALLAEAASRGVRAIVYVSCDPATLARDLSRMPAWRVEALKCFDMFPQTAHVESVCVLVPEAE